MHIFPTSTCSFEKVTIFFQRIILFTKHAIFYVFLIKFKSNCECNFSENMLIDLLMLKAIP